jgi:hypothetical protein
VKVIDTKDKPRDGCGIQLFQNGIKVKTFFFLVCISIIIISTNSFGQSSTEGVKLGLNSATVSGATDYISLQSITAFNIGVFVKFDVAGLFALQPELLYTMKGYKLTHNAVNDQASPTPQPNFFETANNSYLEIPVLLKLYSPSSTFGIIKPNIFMGPELAFELNGNVKYASTTSQPLQQDQGITNSKPTDFGIIFGLGADINLPTATLMFDVRYDLGMKALNFSQSSFNIKNKVITLDAGIGI